MQQKKASVIIVNWNSKDYLKDCLDSLRRSSIYGDLEVIVIDSGSFDGSDKMLVDGYAEVRYIQSDANVGFAKANNIAAGYALTDVLVFINPDTVLDHSVIENALKSYSSVEDCGVMGCRLLNRDGSLQTSAVLPFPTILNQMVDSDCLQRLFPALPICISAQTFDAAKAMVPVDAVSGAFMVIKKSLFNLAGGFPEDYFMYSEDVDLCYQVCALGYKNYYNPIISITHFGGGSSSRNQSLRSVVLIRKSIYIFLKKNRGTAYAVCYRIALMISAIVRVLMLSSLHFFERTRFSGSRNSLSALKKWMLILKWASGVNVFVSSDNR